MSARTFEVTSDSCCRHRLLVLGGDVGDLVDAAGGFLCDRARAGWDVTVIAAGGKTSRSLAILGVTGTTAAVDIVTALRAFKGHALAAAGRARGQDAEALYRVRPAGLRRLYPV